MPIVIATSSIALQKALLSEYLPELSDMLLESGVIRKPLTAILRKGREHYVCMKKLKTYLSSVSNQAKRQELMRLLSLADTGDLAEVEVNRKYGIDVTDIQLHEILAESANTEDEQKAQATQLYQAICKMSGLKRRITKTQSKKVHDDRMDNTECAIYTIANSKVLNKIGNKSNGLLQKETPLGRRSEQIIRLVAGLTKVCEQSAAFSKHNELICWLETKEDEHCLCAIPKDLGNRLFHDRWKKRIPTILTSGTLSAGGDFTHTKRILGVALP